MKTHLLEAVTANREPFLSHSPAIITPLEKLKHFRLDVDADHLAWITFDTLNSTANVWNETTLDEFNVCLDVIASRPEVRAVIIRSAKEKITVAGADLKALRLSSVKKLEHLIDLGQGTFNKLAALPMPKVALIHGACVGGGFEMALACDVRIASDSEITRIGLPETQLGLVPAWGGSTRLPRLIGLAKALDLIISGRQLKGHDAKRHGLVDAVVPREHLENAARAMIGNVRHTHRMKEPVLLRKFIAYQARKTVRAKTRGLYLAPLRAIEVVTRAPFMTQPKAMELEKHAILDLALTPETERLIDVFLHNEEAAKKPWPRGVALKVHDVAVIGAGIMGAGIAHWLASRGHRVLMQDISTESLARGLSRVRDLLSEGLKRRAITRLEMRQTFDRLTPDHTRAPLAHQQMVIEAATEDMALKKKIFADLATRTSADTILATNTSALSVTELAGAVPNPERVIGLHFFNPVHRMPLVEIIVTAWTTDDVIATAVSFVQRLGKTPIVVKDSPGFIVNRILMPYLLEAVRLHDEGVPVTLIDEAMLEFGMPMGPMRLLDEIGLDVAAHVGLTMTAAYPERLPKSETLDRMIAEGKLGRKSGEGFYKHPHKPSIQHWSESHHLLMDLVQERLVGLLRDEARRCSHEGIARSDADIELAMILGTGFPAFRALHS
jgi:3-hydroxyacyl-CoA dehydrogenase/enoyl-CoA hydratase/3-hydroxybutyryl-CoA epimerase